MWLDFGSLICMSFPKVRIGTAVSVLMGETVLKQSVTPPSVTLSE